ncbi:hypothetical protein LTR50_004163 [Elasticomyces elasticus]|nr:hypothetical protein LTR50_004163 [Elasticomyces elasticus]
MALAPSPSDTITQLNAARNLALGDAAFYSQIVPGVTPLINVLAPLELRRWGADFLAETFASPMLSAEEKQKLCLGVLDQLKAFLDTPAEDTVVIKSVVQTAASIYPLVFRHIIANPHDVPTWQKMAAIKSSILRRMDTAPPGVRICCIKFVQRVVQTQTLGSVVDPRRPDQNEISLALVPQDHPVIPPSNLEAEASGLLDRLLGVLQENTSDALIATATLNSLGALVRYRPSIANKILSTVLNFNPLRQTNSSMTPKRKVMIRSMARTTRAFLFNILKRNNNHPLGGRIQQYIERLQHSLTEVFDESSRKRAAPVEPTDGLDHAKRQRLDAEVAATPPQDVTNFELLPGPVSFKQLFTITGEAGVTNFDVQAIPIDIVAKILVPLLAVIDVPKMNNAINAVRARYLSLGRRAPADALQAEQAANGVRGGPSSPYDSGYSTEDAEQVFNRLDNAPPDDSALVKPPEVALGPFRMPPPPPLSEEEIEEYSKTAVQRVFGTLTVLDERTAAKPHRLGLNRLAASNYDRDGWLTVLTRLATRASAGLDNSVVKSERGSRALPCRSSLSDRIRDALYLYVIADFRRRIDVAISWLSEEWFNDRIQLKQAEIDGTGGTKPPVQTYEKWVLKVMDGILVPYLDAKDKVLIRFLSEIPGVNTDILLRVKKLARDPERVGLAVTALQ